MLSPSKLDMCQEKTISSKLHHDTASDNNCDSNSDNIAVPASINNHKRNRQSYSEKEQIHFNLDTSQAVEPCASSSKKEAYNKNISNAEITEEPRNNSVGHKIDNQIDRCSVAKKPRDDISELSSDVANSHNLKPWSQTPSNREFVPSSSENSLTFDEVNENKYVQEDYRLVPYYLFDVNL